MSDGESIGALPKSWRVAPLSELCAQGKDSIVDGPFGSNLKRSDFLDSGIPVLKLQNIKPNLIVQKNMDYVSLEKYEEIKRHSFCLGDIVMTKLGDPLGVSAIVIDIEFGVIVADLVRIRPRNANTKFLCYQLNSPLIAKHLNDNQKGTTRPRINLSIVRELKLNVPPLDEQVKIVEILEKQLSHLDAALASVQAVRKKAERFRWSLLHTAFNGALTGHKNSMGVLPDGWSVQSLSLAADVVMGQSPPGASYNEDGVGAPFFQGKAEFGQMYPTVRKWTTAGSKNAKVGDILLSVRAPVGPTNVADIDCVIGRGLAAIRAKNHMNQAFLLWFLRSFEHEIAAKGTGTTFDSISGDALRNQSINVPPLEEQEKIVEILEEQFSRLDAALEVAETIEKKALALRRSLLHAAYVGELTKEWREGTHV